MDEHSKDEEGWDYKEMNSEIDLIGQNLIKIHRAFEISGGAPSKTNRDLLKAGLSLYTYIAKKVDHSGPIKMVLYCPNCGAQHIDEPNGTWTNPPHRSHLCHDCEHILRPADVPTRGVRETFTKGENDKTIILPYRVGTLELDTVEAIAMKLVENGFTEAGRFICREWLGETMKTELLKLLK